MKDEQLNLFNTEWGIEFFELTDKKRKSSVYEAGGAITLDADKSGDVGQINLKISGFDEFIKLPPFMGIAPTCFENDGVQYVVVIIGTNPCELHRLAIWFGGFDCDKPWFKFKVAPLYDDCVCPEEEDKDSCQDQSIQLRSGHGIGGGTGQISSGHGIGGGTGRFRF